MRSRSHQPRKPNPLGDYLVVHCNIIGGLAKNSSANLDQPDAQYLALLAGNYPFLNGAVEYYHRSPLIRGMRSTNYSTPFVIATGAGPRAIAFLISAGWVGGAEIAGLRGPSFRFSAHFRSFSAIGRSGDCRFAGAEFSFFRSFPVISRHWEERRLPVCGG